MARTSNQPQGEPESNAGTSTMDERDAGDLLRTIAATALHGGMMFIRNRVGEESFTRMVANSRLREPIVRLVGPRLLALPAQEPPRSAPEASPAEPSKFLDEKQLCSELTISPVTATKWRRNAEGPAFVRVGRLIRYPREAVERWLASRTVGEPRTRR